MAARADAAREFEAARADASPDPPPGSAGLFILFICSMISGDPLFKEHHRCCYVLTTGARKNSFCNNQVLFEKPYDSCYPACSNHIGKLLSGEANVMVVESVRIWGFQEIHELMTFQKVVTEFAGIQSMFTQKQLVVLNEPAPRKHYKRRAAPETEQEEESDNWEFPDPVRSFTPASTRALTSPATSLASASTPASALPSVFSTSASTPASALPSVFSTSASTPASALPETSFASASTPVRARAFRTPAPIPAAPPRRRPSDLGDGYLINYFDFDFARFRRFQQRTSQVVPPTFEERLRVFHEIERAQTPPSPLLDAEPDEPIETESAPKRRTVNVDVLKTVMKHPEECPVCFMSKKELAEKENYLLLLPCDHGICRDCLEKIEDQTCPYCRKDFLLARVRRFA